MAGKENHEIQTLELLRAAGGCIWHSPRFYDYRRRGRNEMRMGNPIELLNDLLLQGQTDGAERWRRYFEPIPSLSHGLPAPILGIMVLIWQLRERDLQLRYPLATRVGRLGLLSWCVVHGRHEYRALLEAELFWQTLDRCAQFSGEAPDEYDPAWAISWKMVLSVHERVDLEFDLTTRTGRARLLMWYISNGRSELGFEGERFTAWQIKHFFSPSQLPGLNRLQALLYETRPDVRALYPLPAGREGFVAWCRSFITNEAAILDALRSSFPGGEVAPTPAPPAPFGVNVIGYAFGQLGIGEDARMAVKSLLTTEVPVTLLNFPPGDAISQQDRSMESHVSGVARYRINLFCLAALEHARYFAERGSDMLAGRINIGYWPWELSAWPREWRHLLALVDEVWVSSEHTRAALAAVTKVPVRLMPMAVELELPSVLDRSAFHLPPQACLFLFAFDLNSSAKRKNPRACLEAFLQAFPAKGKNALDAQQVGLVIKVHPPSSPNREWDELKVLQQHDARIHLIEQTLSKADLLALYQICDCFLSLHRAEGFGRCIAEAMLLERPVITTSYSGNMSFTGTDNALLVKYAMVKLGEDDYPFGRGQEWAEPSITDAAKQMRRVQKHSAQISRLARQGRATIVERHHPQVVGARYQQALLTWMSSI